MFFLMLDIGQDGTGLEANARFARDAAALMLQYYQNDYRPIAGNNYYNLPSNSATDLYNGNISCLSTDYYTKTPLLKSFRYDKLNRIKRMQTAGVSAGEWGNLTDDFSTEYRYDYNGNILSLQRLNANAVLMHQINYTYNAKNNRLQAITAVGINSSTYSYDAIGNLANDSGENIGITWNAMNKVKTVVTPNSTLHFAYSPTGQRQIKKTGDKTEYYLHDATGNTMCVYELSGTSLTVKERTIYGSKRIGVYRQRIQLGYSGITAVVVIDPGSNLINILHPSPILPPVGGRLYLEGSNRIQSIGGNQRALPNKVFPYAYKKGTEELKGLSSVIYSIPTFLDGNKTAGLRDYELTDHLSNVMAVISDRKISADTNNDNITDYYAPQVVSYTDYYPFGFPIAERSGNLSGYRFGFNGQESDNEVYGVKTTYAFEYRMQDTRLGRFWSVDPLAKQYPYNSSYAFCENTTIAFLEIEGMEKIHFVGTGKNVDISNLNEKEVKALFKREGYRYNNNWFDQNAEGEYWSVFQGTDFWGHSTGTYMYKYASEASYKSSSGIPYYKGADRNFIQWLAAKDQSLEGPEGLEEGLKLMGVTFSMILSGGGLVLAEYTVGSIFLFAVNSAVTLDDISAIGNEDTFFEGIVRDLGGLNAVKGLQVSKITLGVYNSTKNTIDIGIDLKDGKKIKAVYDVMNKVWTQTNIVISATQMEKNENNKKQKEQ